MKRIVIVLVALFVVIFSLSVYASEEDKNILHSPDIIQEKIKSPQDEKNVISDSEDRDEDSLIKNSDPEDDFVLHPDPDECRL